MAGGLGGLGGGGKGGGGGSGGISPEQMALTQYTFGQNALANAQAFSQMPMSTGKTMSDAGAYMQQALQAQQMSQADTSAMNAFNAQNKSSLSSGIGGLGSAFGTGTSGSFG